MNNINFLDIATTVLTTEAEAITQQIDNLDQSFSAACQEILNCKRRIIIIGMGKSGIIGKKIAATLASTGTAAFFVHPAEAGHGDLGMIQAEDCIILISYSGESYEINTLLPGLKQLGCVLIGISGNKNSSLSRACDININAYIKEEACPLGIAPTASTTATLAIGDALAIACSQARGLSKEDFAKHHPSGALGKKLLLRVRDLMRSGQQIPIVQDNARIETAILEMNSKGIGVTLVMQEKKLIGIFTDGDLRRCITEKKWENETIATQVKSKPLSIDPNTLAVDALKIMENKKITTLIVTENDQVIGVVHIHDILRSGI